MADEDTTPEQPTQDVAAKTEETPADVPNALPLTIDESALPYPGDGQVAVHYTGAEEVQRARLTFKPDSIRVVSVDVAATLSASDGFRVVEATEQGWTNLLALRAKRRAGASG